MKEGKSERKLLLRRLEDVFEGPMVVLGFLWLALLIVELLYGLSPLLETLGYVIWGVFIVDFVIKLMVAPEKSTFLKKNVVTIISLVVPAFRVLRIIRVLRFLRFSRSIRLVKVIGSLNRGMRALSSTMQRRAVGYVILLTTIVLFVGAAGMLAFERDIPGGINTYGSSLWWTSMILTTMGSDYWPQSPEGRILCVILSLYAFAVFGYLTATIATFFIGRDAENAKAEVVGRSDISALRKEVTELKEMIKKINNS